MDIDDLLDFINKDEGEGKKKKGKKKKDKDQANNKTEDNKKDEEIIEKKEDIKEDVPKEETENQEQVDKTKKKKKKKKKNNNENQNTITSSTEPLENKYRSLIKYDENVTITNTRFQDNSMLRLIGNWEEAKDPSTWKQTNFPTKSIDDQFEKLEEFPQGKILEYGEKGIWRSTNEPAKEREKNYEFQIQCMRKSAECHRQIRKYAQTILRPGIKLIDFCEKLELMLKFITNARGTECGQAFPTGCSINHVAAHYTPNKGDETVLNYDDVCKIDFGTHINGYLIDSAFTVAFNPKYDNLLLASKEATNAGIKAAGVDARMGEIGGVIQEVIESFEIELDGKTHKIKPVRNLCGHTVMQYKVHGGKSVPIVKSEDNTKMEEGEMYAIETFVSTGKGFVKETKNWSHYMKDPFAFNNTKIKPEQPRALFKFIDKHFTTLAFCPRWIEEKGFTNYSHPLKYLCDYGMVNPYPPLSDIEGSYVAQFEHTFMLKPTCKEIFSVGDDY